MIALIAGVLLAEMPVPPPMPHRDIGTGWDAASETRSIQDGDVSFLLFVPGGDPEPDLTLHFHGAAWFAIDEHVARGLRGPLIVFNNGQGSSVYQRPFLDRLRFRRWIMLAERAVRSNNPGFRIESVSISSFSAGYGAVREIVRDPDAVRIIRRIVLCDSMYAGFAQGSTSPEPDQIDVWVPFVRSAAGGERTFCFTYSQVPTQTYANSAACGRALAQAAGVPVAAADPAWKAASEPRFPLLESASRAGCQLWGYAGQDAQAHLTHVRHLADVWLALDRAGLP